MKYKPDKTTRILARLSMILMACFCAVVFYFVFKARLNLPSYPEQFAWVQFGLGASVIGVVIWMAVTMFKKEDETKDIETKNDKDNSL